jgi:hypothetical protein
VQTLVDRGVALYFAYTGSVIDYYSYAGQFRHAFAGHGFVDKVRCDFLPHIDHTLITLESQREVAGLVRDWVCSFATPAPARAAAEPATA